MVPCLHVHDQKLYLTTDSVFHWKHANTHKDFPLTKFQDRQNREFAKISRKETSEICRQCFPLCAAAKIALKSSRRFCLPI